MNIRPHLIASALLAVSLVSGTAHAALEGRDLNGSIGSFEAYYDTELNITWLANANLAASNAFGVLGINPDGSMSWDVSQSWIAAMNTNNYLGFSDWRLPITGPVNGIAINDTFSYDGSTDNAYNVSAPGTLYAGSKGSEMAYLFFNELSGKSYCTPTPTCPQPGYGLGNTGPFDNIQAKDSSALYWSDTEYMNLGPYNAWAFTFYSGGQGYGGKPGPFYAWAVRPGDVAAVPEANMWAMQLAGLGLIGVAARRRKLAKA